MMPESPIRKLVPFAEKAKSQGVDVIHLNIGQPDINTPESALQAIRNYSEDVIAYSHSAGNASYRKGLAAYYAKHNIELSGDDIMITTGGSEALTIAFMTCLDEGDELIVPEPFYANYNGFAAATGITIVPVVSNIESGFALPPIEDFAELISPRTKGILICNPGNPTGYLYSKEELEELREIVLKHDLFLFADEVYREFCYEGHRHFSVMELEGLENNAVMIDSVSKRYSMCGVRIGALATRNKELMQTAMKFAQARLSPPSLGQVAGEAALATPDSYFTEVIEEYDERRRVLVDGLNSIPDVICPSPKGAFYAVAELPVDDAEDFCRWMLEDFSHEGATVMMAPCSGFYTNAEFGKRQVRLAYVLEVPQLKKAIEVLKKGIEAYPNKFDFRKYPSATAMKH